MEFDNKAQMLYSNFIAKQNQNNFSEGLVIFTDYNLNYGFKDRFGDIIIKPIYEFAEDFSEGLALVRIARRFGFIDRSGVVVIELVYHNGESFEDGKALVKLKERQFYIDKREKEIG